MAEGIVYLDVDDEITSAAQRIRSAPGTKVALVVPYGSRIATSRMNFRLLSREALVSNRRLSIVSGDAAARSLAASAGLPVFGTVPEYESSLTRRADPGREERAAGDRDAGDRGGRDPDAAGAGTSAATAPAGAGLASSGGLASSATVAAAGPGAAVGGTPNAAPESRPGGSDAPPAGPPATRRSQRPKRPVPDETTPHDTAAWTAPVAGAVAGSAGEVRPARGPELDPGREAAEDRPTRGRGRTPLFAALGLVGLAVVVLGVAAWLFVPAATIAVTPRRTPIGPIELTVSADPTATSVDPANDVVPAVRLDVPVEAERTFTTTGTKVKETVASGQVTFTNYDPTSTNTIPAGSIVSTEGGIRFRTLSTVVVPRASFTPPTTTVPSDASVAIQAVKPGPDGNVPANAIRVVPSGENSLFLAVHNAQDTTGGSHTETPEIKQPDVDKAMATLNGDLEAAFRQSLAAGAGAPEGTTLFPDTATLGAATPDVDPATLVGQALPTFDLKLSAKGTVIAVDPSPVRTLAQGALMAALDAKHRLVPDSIVIDPGSGTVGEDKQVTFQATARATEVAIVDAAALRELVKGKTLEAARAALAPFGDATVTIWPDWASTVTTIDARLTVTVDDGTSGGAGAPGEGPSTAPGAHPSATPRRSNAPSGGVSPRSAPADGSAAP